MASVTISVRKSNVATISGLNDMVIDSVDSSNGAVWSSNACVYSGTGVYSIAAFGSKAAGGNFVLSNGKKNIAYNVAWNDGGAGNLSNNGVALKPGVPSSVLTKATTRNPTCRHDADFGPTARLIITIPPTEIYSADNDNFKETLTLLIAPN